MTSNIYQRNNRSANKKMVRGVGFAVVCYRSVTVPRLAEQKTNTDGRYGRITSAMINALRAGAPVFDEVKSSFKVGAMHE
jgi:hypothetical protein